MFSRPLLFLLILCCTLSTLCFALDYPPPIPTDTPALYVFNFTRVNGLAPLLNMDSEARIKDRFIVAFHSDECDILDYKCDYPLDDHWAHLGQNLSQTCDFHKTRHGYAATVEDAGLLERIRADANVSFVEPSQLIEPSGMPGTE